jgi:hypothetical protein
VSGKFEAKAVQAFKASAEHVLDAGWIRSRCEPGATRAPGTRSFDSRRIGGSSPFWICGKAKAVHWDYYLEIDRPRKLVFMVHFPGGGTGEFVPGCPDDRASPQRMPGNHRAQHGCAGLYG